MAISGYNHAIANTRGSSFDQLGDLEWLQQQKAFRPA